MWKLTMVYGENSKAWLRKNTFPDGKIDRISCLPDIEIRSFKKYPGQVSGIGMSWIIIQVDMYQIKIRKVIQA